MSRFPSILAACTCACALLTSPTTLAVETSLPKGCPTSDGKPLGYMIGSSTMGSVLGPMLKGMIKRRWKVPSRHWGKASSGLARPDFHDWPKAAAGLMKRYKPDFVIVSLGTNDNQALRVGKKWVRPKKREKWEALYAERVRKMLDVLAGKDRKRTVIWMGPTAFEGRTANILGPRINAIMKREVAAFDGNAVFVDVYSKTRKPNGKLVNRFQAPDRKTPERTRGADGIHLTSRAVKFLMAEPSLAPLAPCFEASLATWEAEEQRLAVERAREAKEKRLAQERAKAERKAARLEAYKKRLAEKQAAKQARIEAREKRLAEQEARKQARIEARQRRLEARKDSQAKPKAAAKKTQRDDEAEKPNEAGDGSADRGGVPGSSPKQKTPEGGGGAGNAPAEAEPKE